MVSRGSRGSGARRRSLAATVGAVGICTVGSACGVANTDSGTDGDTGGDTAGDTVRIVLPQEPPTLEPCEGSLTSTGVVTRSNITEPLLERNPTSGELEPLLATEWTQTSDTEWTFTLQEGVTFHDGTEFNAEAAAFSIDRAVNSDLGCNIEGYVFGDVDLVATAVDPVTLTVESPEPDAILPLRLSFVEMVPTSTSTTEKVREPIGTGPYAVGSWEVGQKLTLERYDEYWGDAPPFAAAEYQWRTEGSVRAAMITNDEADIATGLGPEDGAGDLGVAYPNNETTALRIQATEPPLDDMRVRQAINYAIDRDGIITSLFAGAAEPAAQLVPAGVVGHNESLEPWPYDPEMAASLVAEAAADGVPVDEEIRLIGRTAQFPKIAETIEVIQGSLADAGLNVKIEMVDTTTSTEFQQRPFPEDSGPYLLMIQHGNQAGDSAFSMDQYMRSDGFQSAYGTPEFDAKIDAAELLVGDERQTAMAEIFAQEPEEIGMLAYIAHMTGILGVSENVSYEPDAATGDEMRLADMSPTGA